MALFYAYVLEPMLPGGDVRKGTIYAIATWLLNAVVVLPATGEGFAGSAHLTLAGIVWFAAAHSLFFVGLAIFARSLEAPLEIVSSDGAGLSRYAIRADQIIVDRIENVHDRRRVPLRAERRARLRSESRRQ